MTFTFESIDKLVKEIGPGDFGEELKRKNINVSNTINSAKETLAANPILKRYMRHLATGNPRNTEAWQAQGERLYAALLFLVSPQMLTMKVIDPDSNELIEEKVTVEEGKRLAATLKCQASQVYLWTKEIIDMAIKMPLPRHTISRQLLPYPMMFWSFETAIPVVSPVTEEEIGVFNWMLLMEERDAITGEPNSIGVVSDWNKDINTPDGNIIGGQIYYGMVFPDDIETPKGQHLVLALLAFLHTPLLQIAKTRLPRPLRREIKRSNTKTNQNPNDVETNVVTLRRSQLQTNDEYSSGITYKDHRWWVSGHFRAQWYSSVKGHRLIWISPHIKGPDDKPIKEKTYHVKR